MFNCLLTNKQKCLNRAVHIVYVFVIIIVQTEDNNLYNINQNVLIFLKNNKVICKYIIIL